MNILSMDNRNDRRNFGKMKTIRVAAAIIIDNGKVFATQRGYGEFKDGWEYQEEKLNRMKHQKMLL